MKIVHLRANHLKNPLGYDFPDMILSWKVSEAVSGSAKETRVLISEKEDMSVPVYDSGVMQNYQKCQIEVTYNWKARTRYFWKVMTISSSGEQAESENAWFETAKRDEPWEAKVIAASEEKERMPVLYRDFPLLEKPVKARLYLFGAGLYEVEVNGKRAGDEYLLPGYHSYDLLLEYQTFDLTELLRAGSNRLTVQLGEGWYKGRFGFDDVYENLYGDRKFCIAELYLEMPDGTVVKLCTDENWRAYAGNIGKNNIYDGECQDDTLEETPLPVDMLEETPLPDDMLQDVPSATMQEDRAQQGSMPEDAPLPLTVRARLTARSNPPIRKVEEFAPVSERMHQDGYLLLDFGESITGWVEFGGGLDKGQRIRLQYGELLQNQSFYRENLRTAQAEFVYVSNGENKTVRPHFTYYGFRYVKVEGLKAGQQLSFRAFRLMSDIEKTGSIETSNEKVNRLFANTVRSQKCNFLDIPTDCPQRDERMGWTGDVNIFANTACFHMDSAAFFRHYARSLYGEQKLLQGAVPFFAPRPKVPVRENTNPFYLDGGACIWGDVAVALPWTLYRYYGDRTLLKEQYPMMKRWVEYVRGRSAENPVPFLWQNDRQLGDWLALDNGDIQNPVGRTDGAFLASVCFYQAVLTLAEAAEALSCEEAEEYRELAGNIRCAFFGYYFAEDGTLKTEVTQTACAILLHTGLYPENAKKRLTETLERLIAENGGHLNTGFAGTPVLCPALSESGLNHLAYTLLLNEDYPGWLHEVNLGATTVWERWNSLDENGVISGTGMNSLNHYAYGSIADWMYRYMCGFRPSMAEEIPMRIEPMPDARFAFVKGSFDSVYGIYKSEWYYEAGKGFHYTIEIPFNAGAEVIFPNGKRHRLQSGVYHFDNHGEQL